MKRRVYRVLIDPFGQIGKRAVQAMPSEQITKARFAGFKGHIQLEQGDCVIVKVQTTALDRTSVVDQ